MIVADTGAILALIDASDRHHAAVLHVYKATSGEWVLPWAILPEVDFLVSKYLGGKVQRGFLADIANGAFAVEWGVPDDLSRALQLNTRYHALGLGLVDGVVAATAERLKCSAIATIDHRDFGGLKLKSSLKLYPRDWV